MSLLVLTPLVLVAPTAWILGWPFGAILLSPALRMAWSLRRPTAWRPLLRLWALPAGVGACVLGVVVSAAAVRVDHSPLIRPDTVLFAAIAIWLLVLGAVIGCYALALPGPLTALAFLWIAHVLGRYGITPGLSGDWLPLHTVLTGAALAAWALAVHHVHPGALAVRFRNARPSWFDPPAAACAVLSALLVLVAFWLAQRPTATLTLRPVGSFRFASAAQVPIPKRHFDDLDDRTLLYGFLPVPRLGFPAGDDAPRTVVPDLATTYVEDAVLTDLGNGSTSSPPADANTLPSQCVGAASPCYELQLCSQVGALVDATGQPCRQFSRFGTGSYFPLYGLVFRRGEPPAALADGERPVSPVHWEAAQSFPTLSILLQYWAFYPKDEWSSTVLGFGRLSQSHDADWESVTIGLSNSRPLFVATSAHCGGNWETWRSLQAVSQTPPGDPTGNFPPPDVEFDLHPVVVVAAGSHAFYPVGYRGRSPDWPGCISKYLAGSVANLFSESADLVETFNTGFGPSPFLQSPDDTSEVMGFPGFWSPGDTVAVGMPRRRVTLESPNPRAPSGPLTPTLQPLGVDPVGTIFGDPRWRHLS